jgi:hypothetical protein
VESEVQVKWFWVALEYEKMIRELKINVFSLGNGVNAMASLMEDKQQRKLKD